MQGAAAIRTRVRVRRGRHYDRSSLKSPREPPNCPQQLAACKLRVNNEEVQELLERIEIAVAMQKGMPLLYAEHRDHGIDGLPHRPAGAVDERHEGYFAASREVKVVSEPLSRQLPRADAIIDSTAEITSWHSSSSAISKSRSCKPCASAPPGRAGRPKPSTGISSATRWSRADDHPPSRRRCWACPTRVKTTTLLGPDREVGGSACEPAPRHQRRLGTAKR